MSTAKHNPGGQCDACEGFCLVKRSVMEVLRATDDHLQKLQHYGHSHELRSAMAAVQEVLDALDALVNRNATICANEVTLPLASHTAALRALRAARSALAKAKGAAS